MAISAGSSSGRRTRLFQVMVKSAKFYAEKGTGEIYVKLWINEANKFKTKKVTSLGIVNIFSWNQKFVFSVSHSFSYQNDSSIFFEVFRVENYFPDSLLGSAECHIESFFKVHENKKEKENIVLKYDTEEEEEGLVEQEETKTETLPELKKVARIPIMSKGSGMLSWGPPVGKGVLEVEMVLWKGHVTCLGASKCHNLAMEYDDFMGLKSGDLEKKKKKTCLCFAPSVTKE